MVKRGVSHPRAQEFCLQGPCRGLTLGLVLLAAQGRPSGLLVFPGVELADLGGAAEAAWQSLQDRRLE